ncbi:methyltransferase domain-containing protein [Micromonospora soli]|uniref:class I SAM-dependent methyltransferase n=1 Tax=Micromonospora sp. NBRC 110009 TaxID=3061627 RepID=UPI002670D23C|nr:class I SAM-dependent methyltransferase [Micromonospora sp. NBRC 110009]WKU00310.1 methyltransferase domain-containing protein [Micromonospora sp. NBRC 110009]
MSREEGTVFDRAYWEERYRHSGGSGRGPNPQLVAEVGELPPGTALDAGCGEGADARWLAERGWRVTAVDIAAAALQRAREQDHTGRVDWVRADLTTWTPAAAGQHFDLVCASYVHPAGGHEGLLRRLAAAVAPGGTLLVFGHAPAESSPHAPGSHVTPEELAAGLDPERWDVLVAEVRSRPVVGHDGREVMFRDAVLRARRRP